MADVPLQVISENAGGERRITPSWSISQLRTKLEPMTGVPPSFQQIFLKTSGNDRVTIEAADEENTRLSSFPLAPYAELHVSRMLPTGPLLHLFDPANFEMEPITTSYLILSIIDLKGSETW